MQQQAGLTDFANAFAQNGAITMNNILPEELAKSLHDEFNHLNWVLQVEDYSHTDQLQIPLGQISNRDNLVEVLYDREHGLDLNNLFFIRLAVATEDLKSESLIQVREFLNSENFIHSCRVIVGMEDINHAWIEATCYDKGCFLGSHFDDHHPDNRVAFVLNLTRNWKLDWGGLLLLETSPDRQPVIIPPLWNSLSMFRIPVNHTVTSVAQSATEHRYSITGWLRP